MPDRRAVCIEPTVFVDNRGYFFETYNQNDMHEAGVDMIFVQENTSKSVKGVLRGCIFRSSIRRVNWRGYSKELFLM